MAAQAQPPPEPQLGKQASFLTDLDTIKPMLSLPLDGSGPQMSFSSNGSITTTTSAGLLTDKWDKYVTIAAARSFHSVQQKGSHSVLFRSQASLTPTHHAPTPLLRLPIMC